MSTLSATTTRSKPRPKPERRIRVLEQPTDATDGWAAIEVREGKDRDVYLVRCVPCDFAGVTGFEVEKLDPSLDVVANYHVAVADEPAACSCECKGFLRWGHCRHVEGLAVLRSRKPRLFSARDARHEPERCEGAELNECEYFGREDL